MPKSLEDAPDKLNEFRSKFVPSVARNENCVTLELNPVMSPEFQMNALSPGPTR